ncbi:MAG TPA: SseB family protein [Chthoniobacterales bacterium]|nr:SseB family protein [Chthoniobacterales bacterium]
MNDVIEALAEWKNQTITRGQLLRRLLEFEDWMTPIHEDRGEAFARFALDRARLIPNAEDKAQIFLLSSSDATEAVRSAHAAEGGMGFSNPTGWEIFSANLNGVDAVVIDPGAPHELGIDSSEFSEIQPLADAVGIEEVWQRLRSGNEEEDDVARAARYPGYHIAVVERDEGWLLIHVPHDDGGMFVPVFTHDDALALALDEFRANFAEAELKTMRTGGAQLFPALAKEKADGIVFNYQGPGEPTAFRLDMTDIMLAELARDNGQSGEAVS